jgi:WD40 repeat protein
MSAAIHSEDNYIQVIYKSHKLGKEIKDRYHASCCMGEIIRNCCVNLGFFDVDTVDGVTNNAIIRRKQVVSTNNKQESKSTIPDEEYKVWDYDPNKCLKSVVKDTILLDLQIEPLDN